MPPSAAKRLPGGEQAHQRGPAVRPGRKGATGTTLPEEVRRDVLSRMSRIEGQARGVQRMIEDGRDCADIVHQISAIRAALAKVGASIVAENLEECVRLGLAGDNAALRQARRALLDLV